MHIGFTGSQTGMTPAQRNIVCALLFISHCTGVRIGAPRFESSGVYFHHGDCVGADAEAHDIARDLMYHIVGHPPDDDKARAFKEFDDSWDVKPYLTRNREMVDACDVLIATPKGLEEELRSGTWATIRYAKKTHTNIVIIYPPGNTELAG